MSSSGVPTYQADQCNLNQAGTAFIVASPLLFCIATIVVPLRLYVRLCFTDTSFGWDDICLAIAYMFAVPTLALLWRMFDLGLGRHADCYPDQNRIQAIKLEYIAEYLMIISTIFSRSSVALFVTRLFGVTRRMRIALYCWTAFMCVSLLVTACLIWAECTPVQALWDYHLLPEATCWSKSGLYFVLYYNSAVGILSDFLLAMLPSYFLSKLQMSRKLRISLMILMAIGLIPMICAICRTAYASTQATVDDPLYRPTVLTVTSTIETLVLIICASVPALMPLFRSARLRLSQIQSSIFSQDVTLRKSPPSESSGTSERNLDRVSVAHAWSVSHAPRTSSDHGTAGMMLKDLTCQTSSSV